MKCTELLTKDHQIILRAVNVLEEMAEEVKRGQSVDSNDVESILRFLREFEDEHHQTKEESALFPVLGKNAGTRTKLGQIIFEHDQERSLLGGLEEALKTKQGADFVHFATRLSSLLRSHIYKEEIALFGLIEITLSNQQDNEVIAEFSRFDEELEHRHGAELSKALLALENRYLSRRSA
jgi:hemerythrin-like domain-containing protein